MEKGGQDMTRGDILQNNCLDFSKKVIIKKKKPRELFWTKRDREANSQMHYEYQSDARTKNSAVRDSFKSTE